jgi:Ca2+-binding RTX toxin-like protein
MAIVTFNTSQSGIQMVGANPFLGLFSYQLSSTSATGFTFELPNGTGNSVISFAGKGLTYTKDGQLITDITAGRITAVSEVDSGVFNYSITGMNVSAAALFDASKAGDTGYLARVVLSGDDSVYGTNGTAGDVLGGANGDDLVEGFAGNDQLFGGSGVDTLQGDRGSDTLVGGTGVDFLMGGVGRDAFLFDTAVLRANADRVDDFVASEDQFILSRADFKAIGAKGTLLADAFHAGTAAADAEDRVIYDATTGKLFYDADGTGARAAVLFAVVDAQTALGFTDFTIIA